MNNIRELRALGCYSCRGFFMTKVCNKCNESREYSKYGNDKRNSDGLQGICNPCKDAYKKKYREISIATNQYVLKSEKTYNTVGGLRVQVIF